MITMNVIGKRGYLGPSSGSRCTPDVGRSAVGIVLAVVVSLTLLFPASMYADDNISVKGSASAGTDLLTDSAAATQAQSVPAAEAWGSEAARNLHISGYFQTNQGVFIKPP